MSQSLSNDETVPIGDDMDQGQQQGDQASHIVLNLPRVGSSTTPVSSVVS